MDMNGKNYVSVSLGGSGRSTDRLYVSSCDRGKCVYFTLDRKRALLKSVVEWGKDLEYIGNVVEKGELKFNKDDGLLVNIHIARTMTPKKNKSKTRKQTNPSIDLVTDDYPRGPMDSPFPPRDEEGPFPDTD